MEELAVAGLACPHNVLAAIVKFRADGIGKNSQITRPIILLAGSPATAATLSFAWI